MAGVTTRTTRWSTRARRGPTSVALAIVAALVVGLAFPASAMAITPTTSRSVSAPARPTTPTTPATAPRRAEASGGSPATAAVPTPIGTVTRVAAGIANPISIATGGDGKVWFGDCPQDVGGFVGRMSTDGTYTTFGGDGVFCASRVRQASDGALWIANGNRTIGRMQTDGTARAFPVPGIDPAVDLAAGPAGTVWFVTPDATIGLMAPNGATLLRPLGSGSVRALATDGSGNLWLGGSSSWESADARLWRLTPQGSLTAFPVALDAPVTGLVVGPDANLWLTASDGTIARRTPAGSLTTWSVGATGDAGGLTTGPDGQLWFARDAGLGHVTTTGVLTTVDVPATTPRQTRAVAAGPDGEVWFTQTALDRRNGIVGHVTTAGAVTVVTGTGIAQPEDMTRGPDGAIWVTNQAANGLGPSVGRIALDGTVTRLSFPTGYPSAITAGPDGNLWVGCEQRPSAPGDPGPGIARMTPSGAITCFPHGSSRNTIDLAAGPGGDVWFTLEAQTVDEPSIGRITTTGVVTLLSSSNGAFARHLGIASDGSLWFTGNRGFGRVSATNQVTLVPDGRFGGSSAPALGRDGALWAKVDGGLARIRGFDDVTVFPSAAVAGAGLMTTGPDGNPWFANPFDSTAGRVAVDGTVTVFHLPGITIPTAIAGADDGGVWVANRDNTVYRITAANVPAAPAVVRATGGGTRATVWWSPGDDGGAPVTTTSATVVGPPGGPSCTAPAGVTHCDLTGLTPGTAYTVAVHAANAVGQGPDVASPPFVSDDGVGFHPLPAPVRIRDSRPPPEQIGPDSTPWGPGTTRPVAVGGTAGVPATATAAVVNVTVTATTAASFLTAWPTGSQRPTASTLNWSTGQTIANAAIVPLGPDGSFSVFNASGSVHVIVDVVGWFDPSPGEGFVPATPLRILDTRPPPELVGPLDGPLGPDTERVVDLGWVQGLPYDADTVVVNVTVTGTTAESFLTAWPTGAPRPTASSLNWRAGTTIAANVTVKIGDGRRLSLYNRSGVTSVIVDLLGWYRSGGGDRFHPATPTRFLDSRPPPEQVGAFATPWTTGAGRTVDVLTGGAAPAFATAVAANVTVTATTANSHLSARPDPSAPAYTSLLNWSARQTIANATILAVGDAATVYVTNNDGSVDVIADAAGWFG